MHKLEECVECYDKTLREKKNTIMLYMDALENYVHFLLITGNYSTVHTLSDLAGIIGISVNIDIDERIFTLDHEYYEITRRF